MINVLVVFAILAVDFLSGKVLDETFVTWKKEFLVRYNSDKSETEAFKNFAMNKKLIDEHNKLYQECNSSFSLGLWEMSDKTATELNGQLNGLQSSVNARVIYISGIAVNKANVSYLNYTEMNYVTRVLNQGLCGSCWAFAALGALEAQIYKKFKTLIKLSEQQLVDCDDANFGCGGGVMGKAYDYIKANGITSYIKYPYRGLKSKSCVYTSDMFNATVTDYIWQRIPNESFLADLLFSVGPLAVGVDASLFTFTSYKTGVFDDDNCSKTELNHAMLLVGFGTDSKWGDYWILRNSYGMSWGEKGYMRLKRGSNMCGIMNYVVFPKI